MTTSWQLDKNTGWVSGILHMPSPNKGERPQYAEITLGVIHNISLPPGVFGTPDVCDFFMNRLDHQSHPYFAQLIDLQVSAHFFIQRTGQTTQFVSCHKKAWHAGQSFWEGKAQCNDFSIGIELEGTDDQPYTQAQYDSLIRLAKLLKQAYSIQSWVGHSDIAPGRKTDPGSCFDWKLFREKVSD